MKLREISSWPLIGKTFLAEAEELVSLESVCEDNVVNRRESNNSIRVALGDQRVDDLRWRAINKLAC
jgi:hypothetical protein